jgi:hypothetical protein
MQKKVIRIPFNRSIFIADQKNTWRFSSRRIIKSYITYTIGSVLCLLLGIYTEKNSSFPVARFVGEGYLAYMFFAWIGYVERWIKFNKATKAYADRFENEGMDCTYTFNDKGIEYQDKEKMYRLAWHLFKPFEAYKGTIYIKLKSQENVSFHLSLAALGDQDYDEVYGLLEQKIG